MTDNEIIKALECCGENNCFYCPYVRENPCSCELNKATLDLINRQKAEIERLEKELENERGLTLGRQSRNLALKAEIERLQQTYPHNRYPVCVKVRNGEIYTHTLNDYEWLIGDISAEAIKEFAERVKEEAYCTEFGTPVVDVEDIDNLLKERVGDSNG